MSTQIDRDPRAVLVREKYFTLRPKPLEHWIWQQGIPQAAERVFWLHWEEGMRQGTWCSELALKQVARHCCVDTSTVTRAYQVLKKLELIRREDPGRDPKNPFQQAIAITELLVPRELLVTLARCPSRGTKPPSEFKGALRSADPQNPPAVLPDSIAGQPTPAAPVEPALKLSRGGSSALMKKLSPRELSEFFLASRDRRTAMGFDESTVLTPEERGQVLDLLGRVSREKPTASPVSAPLAMTRTPAAYAKPRKLSPLEAARIRKIVVQLAPAAQGTELFRQVLWSMEEGALRRFDPRLATNIALKKIRDGAWTRPNRMPPNWLAGARSEACSAA